MDTQLRLITHSAAPARSAGAARRRPVRRRRLDAETCRIGQAGVAAARAALERANATLAETDPLRQAS